MVSIQSRISTSFNYKKKRENIFWKWRKMSLGLEKKVWKKAASLWEASLWRVDMCTNPMCHQYVEKWEWGHHVSIKLDFYACANHLKSDLHGRAFKRRRVPMHWRLGKACEIWHLSGTVWEIHGTISFWSSCRGMAWDFRRPQSSSWSWKSISL